MPKFKYIARDAAGRRVQRSVDAATREEVVNALRRDGLVVVSVAEESGGAPMRRPAAGAGPRRRTRRARLKSGDLAVFTRQFATMISAGIPVLECLEVLAEQAADPGFRALLTTLTGEVRGGGDLSAAFGRFPKVFSSIYVNMLRAGEASGQLDEILVRLAEYMEASDKLRRDIKSAMTYPVISITLILLIAGFLMIYIIPKFQEIFKSMGMEKLPAPTRMVLAVSHAIKTAWWGFIIGAVGVFFLYKWYRSTESGGYNCDLIKVKLPVFGPLFQKVAISRFSRTFSTLIRSGVPILGALEIVAATSGNKVIERSVLAAREAVRAGEPLSKPLGESPIFPPMVVRMIAIGERSGALEQLLEKISQFYDEQVSAAVEALTSTIEPLMIGVMGLVVGGIVLAIFLPIIAIQKEVAR